MAIFCVGCLTTPRIGSINFEQVVDEETKRQKIKEVVGKMALENTLRPSAARVEIPPLRARDIVGIARSQNELRQMLQAELEDARAVFSNRLRRFYQTDLEQFIAELKAQGSPFEDELETVFAQKLREAFDRSATKRAIIIPRYHFLAGFPDNYVFADPQSPSPPRKIAVDLEVGRLRAELKEIDEVFNLEVKSLVEDKAMKFSKNRQELTDRIQRKREELDKRADEEAKFQMRELRENIELKLASSRDFSYENVLGKVVSTPALQAMKLAVEVPSKGNLDEKPWVREKILADLETWSALTNTKREPPSPGVPDRTLEFIEWRRTKKTGP